MAQSYTEDSLVEQPAIQLFAEMGWQTLSALEEVFGVGSTLGREIKGEVVLVPRLRAMLERLNPSLPPEAISAAIDQLNRDRSVMSLTAANREAYELLKDGVEVSVTDAKTGGQEPKRVRVIDWENTTANDFLLVSQFSAQVHSIRAGLTLSDSSTAFPSSSSNSRSPVCPRSRRSTTTSLVIKLTSPNSSGSAD